MGHSDKVAQEVVKVTARGLLHLGMLNRILKAYSEAYSGVLEQSIGRAIYATTMESWVLGLWRVGILKRLLRH